MTERERWISVVEFGGPDRIPCNVGFSPAVWNQYRERLVELVRKHPTVCDEFQPPNKAWDDYPPVYREGEYFTDAWDCVWYNTYGGIEGQIVRCPLDDWKALDTYRPPDPLTQAERGPRGHWEQIQRQADAAREQGKLVRGHADRFFERVHFVRGYENFLFDVGEGRAELLRLIDMILNYDMALVEKWLEIGVDVIDFADDLGSQDRLQISPEAWREYFKPGYAQMMGRCREAGAHVRLHCDGYIVDIMPDLIEIGVTVLNPQDLCNGLDNIARELKGKICIDLDVDRQFIVPFQGVKEIDDHVRRCVETLGSPAGGLMMACGIYPGTPFENIEAVCEAMERYQGMFGG